jgi:hypothetical protein
MHILASGPEQQAIYFGHVSQAEIEKKRTQALTSFKTFQIPIPITEVKL